MHFLDSPLGIDAIRNEGINAKIKSQITSALRTNFIKLTDIVKICNDDEMHKIESILFKMRDSKYLINQNLETQLNKYYSPVISKKIYQEYAKSYEYLSPTVTFEGSAIYLIQSSNPSVKMVYNSNIEDGYFCCPKLIHIGIACAHLISVWISNLKPSRKQSWKNQLSNYKQ